MLKKEKNDSVFLPRQKKDKAVIGRNKIIVYKKIGQTPLDVIKELRQKNDGLKDVKIGYAGRLDPMAEGVLILLLGEENKHKSKYEGLDKTYEIEILLGFSTDTYDVLGKVLSKTSADSFNLRKVDMLLKGFEGKFSQEYPPYSSKAVNGKPLYYYARRNLITKIKVPAKEVEIYSIRNIGEREIGGKNLFSFIENKISLVKGDFRQEEILKIWRDKIDPNESYKTISLIVNCSSGVYMRSLANNFGLDMGMPSFALSIKRTSIGEYNLESSDILDLWKKQQ